MPQTYSVYTSVSRSSCSKRDLFIYRGYFTIRLIKFGYMIKWTESFIPVFFYYEEIMEKRNMRVFDIYSFNVANKTKIKDTKNYIDKMLEDMRLSYGEISFTILSFMTDIEKVVEKHPNLAKYKYYYEPFRTNVLTSLTPGWMQGDVYAKEEDKDAVFDVFSKIPRGFNVTGSIILHHIDWYDEGKKELAICGNEFSGGKANICDDYSVLSSSIHIMRNYDDGNKFNRLKLIVEATSEGVPRNTKELIKMLEKYIGKPDDHIRRCIFDDEQTKHFLKLQEDACELLAKRINEEYQADQNEYVKRMSDSFIPALVDKKMISKSFADTGFSIVKNNKTLPGANTLRYIDEHHFLYEVLIDRTQMCQSFFRFYIFISGCNFQIRNTQDVIFADSREEAAKKLSRLAEFCVKLREEFGEYLSERFGDTPEWYEWDAGDC